MRLYVALPLRQQGYMGWRDPMVLDKLHPSATPTTNMLDLAKDVAILRTA